MGSIISSKLKKRIHSFFDQETNYGILFAPESCMNTLFKYIAYIYTRIHVYHYHLPQRLMFKFGRDEEGCFAL